MRNYLLLSFLLLTGLLSGCNEGAKEGATQEIPLTTIETTTVATNASIASSEIIVRDKQGQEVRISRSGDQLTVSTPNMRLISKAKGVKRKYYKDGTALAYVVKYKGSDFKLRDANEELLWKVKKYADKIKLGEDEELENYYELKEKEGKVAFTIDGRESVRYHTKVDEPIKIRDDYTVENTVTVTSPGLLLMDKLPKEQAFILMAELSYPLQ